MTLTLTTSRRLRSTDSRRHPIPCTGRCRSLAISLARNIHLAGDLAFLVAATNRNNVPGLSYELAAGKAGLPSEFIPQSLRHFYASTALAHGIPITEVSRWLGHKSIQVTHRIYGHLVPTSWDRTRTVLDDARRAGRHQPPNPETPTETRPPETQRTITSHFVVRLDVHWPVACCSLGRDGLSRPRAGGPSAEPPHRLQTREDVYPSFREGLATIEVAEVGSAAWRLREFTGAQRRSRKVLRQLGPDRAGQARPAQKVKRGLGVARVRQPGHRRVTAGETTNDGLRGRGGQDGPR